MDYEFSDIPLENQGKKLRLNSRIAFNMAYGQLIALIFIPICILAAVGSYVVLDATTKAAKAIQSAQAQEILVRYEPAVKNLATILHTLDGKEKAQSILQAMQIEKHLNRAVVVDINGTELLNVGRKDLPWPDFPKHRHFIESLESPIGDVYGNWAGISKNGPVWLLVDVKNEQLTIARYQVLLAVAVTGLITILLLLLCLNIYSKRWIAPIYEMRLHLQQTDHTNLYKPMHVVSSGELNMLQRDIVFLLRRLHVSYQGLKEYAEQTESDLRNAYDDMEIQNITIRSARDEAVLANETKSAFLANISHELRTPLNSIDGFVNLLARRQDLNAEQNMYVQTIRKSSGHLLALLNDVLDFSKIEAGKLVLELQEINFHRVIYDVVDMLTPLAAEKNINLAVFYYEDVPTKLIADELRCKQILTNLVSNAIKFTDKGEILVRVTLAEDVLPNNKNCRLEQVLVSVQDSGKGVDEKAQANLFQRFSQADKSITRQYGGTGLGLVISKQLTQLMGGDIGYLDNATTNMASNGSTFWFSVPVKENLAQPALPMLNSQHNIIACLEHEVNLNALTGYLTNMGGTLTKVATTAGLLDKVHSNAGAYDCIIIDGKEDLEAILRGIRTSYGGHILAFGYQVSLNHTVLEQYGAQALNQPINRYELSSLLNGDAQYQPIKQNSWHALQVLAVDDHMPNLMVLDALLSELDVNVTTVNSGAEAIDTFNRQNLTDTPFDLIFMDIQMPQMSGFETSEQIRVLEKQNQHTPIIALTAHALADEKEKILSSGMDDYAGKPISHPQLVEILKKWFPNQQENQVTENHKQSALKDNDEPKVIHDKQTNHHVAQKNVLSDVTIKLVDWEDALARSANKADLAKDILTMFLESLPKEKEELQAAWEMTDIPELAQIVHRILGGTRYTGVPLIRQSVTQTNQLILANVDKPDHEVKQLLSQSYQQLMTDMDKTMALDVSTLDGLA